MSSICVRLSLAVLLVAMFATEGAAGAGGPAGVTLDDLAVRSHALLGRSLGSRGITMDRAGGPPRIYVTGGYGGLSGDDQFWSVVEYESASGEYRPIFVSPYYDEDLLALDRGDLFCDDEDELVIVLADGEVLFYDLRSLELEDSFGTMGLSRSAGVEVGDVDLDGCDELLVTTDDGLFVFTPQGLDWSVPGASGRDVTLGQLDDDPGLEIATAGGYVVDVASRAIESTLDSEWGHSVTAGDLDGDGKDELVVGVDRHALAAFEDHSPTPIWREQFFASRAELIDGDGDGAPEMLVPDRHGGYSAYDSRTLERLWELDPGGNGVGEIVVGNLDDDPALEMAWGNLRSDVWLHVREWPSGGPPEFWRSRLVEGRFAGPERGDLDGDGEDELVLIDRDGGGWVVVFDPETWSVRTSRRFFTLETDPRSNDGPWDFVLHDFDGDGRDEIVLAGGAWAGLGMIQVLGFDGKELDLLAANDLYPVGPDTFHSVAIGDVDGDGEEELVVGATGNSQSFSVRAFDLATGAVEWDTGVLVTPGPWITSQIADLALADLDANGIPEIVTLVPNRASHVLDGRTGAVVDVVQGGFQALDVWHGNLPGLGARGDKIVLGTAERGGSASNSVRLYDFEHGALRLAREYRMASGVYGITADSGNGLLWISTAGRLRAVGGHLGAYEIHPRRLTPVWRSANYLLWGRAAFGCTTGGDLSVATTGGLAISEFLPQVPGRKGPCESSGKPQSIFADGFETAGRWSHAVP